MSVQLLAQEAAETVTGKLTTAGWIVMVTAIALVLALSGFCFYRVMTDRPKQRDS